MTGRAWGTVDDERCREIFLALCSDDYRYLFIDNAEGGQYDLAISITKALMGIEG